MKAFTQIAIGVAFSAVSRMLMPGQKLASQGVRTSVGFGEDAPATIILGRTATAGDLVYANSHGHDNEYYVLVLELSDLPARLRRVMVNGAWVTLSATDGKRGRSVVEYRRKGEDHLWVKFFDGRQTAASATLREHYGDDPDRPWGADMIGRGHRLCGRHRALQPGGPPRRAGAPVRARRRKALRPAARQLGRRLGLAALEQSGDLVRLRRSGMREPDRPDLQHHARAPRSGHG